MQRRLVLGLCGSLGGVIDRLAVRTGNLTVVSPEQPPIDTGRPNVTHRRGHPDDASEYPDRADLVFVAGEDAETNAAAARAAREAYPDAHLVVYAGLAADAATEARIAAVADRVIDADRILTNRVAELTTGTGAERLTRLYATLRRIDGRLAVVMHENPDPDAIASALGLVRVADCVGLDADACYFGEISHQENRAMVNLLDLDLVVLGADDPLRGYDGVALVDHSRPGVNDRLPEDTTVDIVVDHHPPRAPVEARFVDLRHDIGATSTLVADYLSRADVAPGESLATALLFGIRIDTDDFAREVSTADFEAAAWLVSRADLSVLKRVESPSMTPEVVETLSRAIRNRDVRGDALASNVGAVRDRDALAQAADRLVTMNGIRIAVVYGFKDGMIYVSGRARGTDVDLGETLRDALDSIGSAGGHADMAGAQVPLGILDDADEDSEDELTEVVTDVVAGRLFETLEDATTLLGPDRDTDWAFEFPFEGFEGGRER
ncbi:DHH family phosphoesterase [Halobellus ruber]|uniref:Bifunctional oligoribonuclease/PAP phosphatase NrnA n=1 Tax=Halobellus ruber TaxID=2761102 RepID=A0A7J9SH17_9EURY|nr:bifunctional oligoribonuclease/PAP phosphatase NrnA [Halobellus ruber]MBB6645296.1 bifunctional oligoribonuclease/PAP phosphatase NrnA [Halobellus ruber]